MIEVGEYVRFRSGFISKILDIKKNSSFDLICEGVILSSVWAVKHSKNIIDLIEVGDYVNGFKILEVHEPYPPFNEKILDIGYGMAIFEDSIKTILTKKQMEANQYVVK